MKKYILIVALVGLASGCSDMETCTPLTMNNYTSNLESPLIEQARNQYQNTLEMGKQMFGEGTPAYRSYMSSFRQSYETSFKIAFNASYFDKCGEYPNREVVHKIFTSVAGVHSIR